MEARKKERCVPTRFATRNVIMGAPRLPETLIKRPNTSLTYKGLPWDSRPKGGVLLSTVPRHPGLHVKPFARTSRYPFVLIFVYSDPPGHPPRITLQVPSDPPVHPCLPSYMSPRILRDLPDLRHTSNPPLIIMFPI